MVVQSSEKLIETAPDVNNYSVQSIDEEKKGENSADNLTLG